MKKVLVAMCLIVVMLIIFYAQLDNNNSINSGIVRIHIRANSNSYDDQRVKYAIKDTVVEFLTPVLAQANDSTQALDLIEKSRAALNKAVNQTLKQQGFSYKAQAEVCNQFFAAREYDGVTLESGYYDALIVRLGDGLGDNWFCVAYPPLCFLGAEGEIKYKSLLRELLKK